MASTTLIPVLVELKLNPLPYGRLSMAKGIWDQILAQKAYEEAEDHHLDLPKALDRKI